MRPWPRCLAWVVWLPGSSSTRRCATRFWRVLYAAPSQVVITPFQDLFGHREQVNVPGTVSETNWSYRLPTGMDQLEGDAAAMERLSRLARESGRAR